MTSIHIGGERTGFSDVMIDSDAPEIPSLGPVEIHQGTPNSPSSRTNSIQLIEDQPWSISPKLRERLANDEMLELSVLTVLTEVKEYCATSDQDVVRIAAGLDDDYDYGHEFPVVEVYAVFESVEEWIEFEEEIEDIVFQSNPTDTTVYSIVSAVEG